MVLPERRGGKMLQNSFVLPALCSAIASLARLSSLPAKISASISLSHSSESYFRNQALNAASSSRLSCWTSFANSSIFAIILTLHSHCTILWRIRHGAVMDFSQPVCCLFGPPYFCHELILRPNFSLDMVRPAFESSEPRSTIRAKASSFRISS